MNRCGPPRRCENGLVAKALFAGVSEAKNKLNAGVVDALEAVNANGGMGVQAGATALTMGASMDTAITIAAYTSGVGEVATVAAFVWTGYEIGKGAIDYAAANPCPVSNVP